MSLELDRKAKQLAKDFKNLEKELLDIIMKIDQTKSFYDWGYNSLFAYVNEALELSPAQSYSFINVARKSHEVPELKKEIETGKLSISKAQKMTSILTKENQAHWIKEAREKTHRELEREVSLSSPKQAVKEKVQYVNPDEKRPEKVIIKQKVARVAMEIGVSEKLMLKLRRAQDLISQKQKRFSDLEESLEAIVDTFLEKHDPVQKAQRQKVRGKLPSNSSREEFPSKTQKQAASKRNPIPARVKHQVQLRDGGRCTYRSADGSRCKSQKYLEFHHIQPVSEGGNNSVQNLTLLCSGHHKATHRRMEKPNRLERDFPATRL